MTDPWGDLVNYFREANLSQVRYALVRDALGQQARGEALAEAENYVAKFPTGRAPIAALHRNQSKS